MGKFSLIWAESDSRESFSDFSFIKALGLENLIYLGKGENFGMIAPSLVEFFTLDRETIALRSELFTELVGDTELYRALDSIFADLTDIYKLKQEKEGKESNESLLFSIKELEIYIVFIDKLKALFEHKDVKSAFLSGLKKEAERLYLSEDYARLREEVAKQSHKIKNVKSVTIGINLDAQLHPFEAGVVKVNEEPYVSGGFIDKLLRLNFSENEFVCTAPLLAVQKSLGDRDLAVLNGTLNTALNKIFSASLRSWERTIRQYSASGLGALFGVMYEWCFISACTDALLKIKQAGGGFCIPTFSNKEEVIGLYHPILSLNADHVIASDLGFDEKRIYILTGPNQGGKSIYTQSVGILYAMLHLGLPLPAKKAAICPVDAIMTHFVDNSKQTYKAGRLEAECREISEINRRITKNSLFLFDEALSSTSADEAEAISTEILKAYAEIGAKGIFTTHLHHLCTLAEDTEDEPALASVGTLSAEIVGDAHMRSFRIKPGTPYGKSFAVDIAQKYHLTKEEILGKKQ